MVSTKKRKVAAAFLKPAIPAQRQYEALRAYFVEDLSAEEAAERFGYSSATIHVLAREYRAGRLRFFTPTKTGPKRARRREAVQDRVVELRKQNYSVYDIQRILRQEGIKVSHVLISQILKDEGFAKLPRRTDEERLPIARPEPSEVADIRKVCWSEMGSFETTGAGLFIFVPTLVNWGVDRWVRQAGLPGSQMIPALQSFLSILALKLTGRERLSHVSDVCSDPGFALFSGLNVLPKTTALSTYSYRITRSMTSALLERYTRTLQRHGLLPGASFNLDFHAIPQRGEEAVLEKHYISRRSRRERAVLAFLVQDTDTRALCYANATIRQDQAAEEILAFVDFWTQLAGKPPPHLVFDSQLTTHEVLGQLDEMGITFITLRRRGAGILKKLGLVPPEEWRRMRLRGVSRRYQNPTFTESRALLRPVHRPLRQIAVRGLGHEEPTLVLTNDYDTKPAALVERYAHRMLIENSIAENIDFFHLDALCSGVALQVDFDLMLTLLANGLYRSLARRLTGFEASQPKQVFRRFLNTSATVRVTDTEVHVRVKRRAHHPILIDSQLLDAQPAVPWWQGRKLRLEVA